MIDSRRNLIDHVRQFIKLHLGDIYNSRRITVDPPLRAPTMIEGKRNPKKIMEQATVRFDGFVVEIKSAEEEGPFGWIQAYNGQQLIAEGPPDHMIWANVGAAIREAHYGRR